MEAAMPPFFIPRVNCSTRTSSFVIDEAVIASDKREAFAQGSKATKQPILPRDSMDCFAPLAMTPVATLLEPTAASARSAASAGLQPLAPASAALSRLAPG